jgi:tetratricopeptide (TPR) repeat protein
MEIPQNILKELEERKLKALLGSAELATDANTHSINSGQALIPANDANDVIPADAGIQDLDSGSSAYSEPISPITPISSMAQTLSNEQKTEKPASSGFKMPKLSFKFFGGKSRSVLTSTVEAPQKTNLNIPLSPIGPISPIHSTGSGQVGLIESYPHKPTGSELFFEYISKIAIYFAIFLTPLFFMNSSDMLGLSKQLLLSTLALVSIAGWVGKIISAGSISWRRNITLWPALLVAVSAVFSSFFSSSFWVSFLGDTGRFAFAGISIISYLIIFYVSIQSFSKKDFAVSMWLWLSSVFIASLFGTAQIFGKFILPGEAYRLRTFNTVSSPFHLAIFAASSIPFLVAFLQGVKNWRVKSIALVMAAVQLSFAILVDFRVAWISLAISGVFLVLINFKNPTEAESAAAAHKEYQKSIVPPLFLIVFAVSMLFIAIPAISGFQIPIEANPSYGVSLDVMAKTLKSWPVFGSGLETFPYVYAKFKDVSLNQTDYWGINFNDSIAEAFTWPTTSGAFGTVALLSFIILFSTYAFKRIGARGSMEGGFGSVSAKAGIFSSWIFILASKFFYPTSLPLEFIFWLLPALFVISCNVSESGEENTWRYFFQAGSFKTLGIFLAMMVLLLGTLIGAYFSVKRFVAERVFVKALIAEDKPENRDGVINDITSAITSDPYEVRYFRVLSQVLFQKMNDVVATIQKRPEADRKATPEESTLLQNLTIRTINSIQRAVALDPKNVGVSTEAAESYKGLISLVQGAVDLAIQSYETASEMEPINPYIKTQLGQLYLVKSNLFGDGTGFVDQEIAAKARALFEKALELNTNYANARYFLGLMQDKAGERQAALENFRLLKAANPDNELIAQITQNIENGIPALGYPPQTATTPPQSSSEGSAKGVPPGTTPTPAPAPKTPAPKK